MNEREYGRIRLEEATARELMAILYEARGMALEDKVEERETRGTVTVATRLRIYHISRIWKEMARMFNEQGWERP